MKSKEEIESKVRMILQDFRRRNDYPLTKAVPDMLNVFESPATPSVVGRDQLIELLKSVEIYMQKDLIHSPYVEAICSGHTANRFDSFIDSYFSSHHIIPSIRKEELIDFLKYLNNETDCVLRGHIGFIVEKYLASHPEGKPVEVTDEMIDLFAAGYGELTEGNKHGELTFAYRVGAKAMRDGKIN